MRSLTLSVSAVLVGLVVSVLAAGASTACGSDSDSLGTSDSGVVYILSVRPSSATKNVGETQSFQAVLTPNPGDAPGFRWESSDPSVATVDANGVATAIAPGTATIRVRRDDATAEATFVVTRPSDGSAPDGGDAGPAKKVLYVSSLGGESVPSIRVFALDAKDDAMPLRSIVGASTKLGGPSQMAIAGGELFVADGDKRVLVFDAAANGDVAPKRTIEGDDTGFTNFSPSGVAVIGSELFVSDQTAGIFVFPSTASGNVAPTRKNAFYGAKHVSTSTSANELLVAVNGTVQGFLTSASGTGVTPVRTLQPGKSGARGVYGNNDGVYVATAGPNASATEDDAIVVFAADAKTDDPPLRTISGTTSTGLDDPHGIAVAGGEIFVANQNESSVRVWDETANGDVPPKRVIKGPTTGLAFPAGLLVATEP